MQIVLSSRGGITAEEIRRRLAPPPSNSAARSILRILVEKGRLVVRRDGRRYLYRAETLDRASRLAALADTVRTFFGGSVTEAAAALVELDDGDDGVDPRVREALERLLREQGHEEEEGA